MCFIDERTLYAVEIHEKSTNTLDLELFSWITVR